MRENTFKKTFLLTLALIIVLAVFASCKKDDTNNPIDVFGPSGNTNDPSGNPQTPNVNITPGSNISPDNTIDPTTLDGTDDDNATPEPKRTYEEYLKLNSDVIGWIKIADTSVDYPVVHSHDNKDYLVQTATKSPSKSGAIFLDYRSKTSGKHLILYGHNMSKSKTMFAQITSYAQRSFYDNHRTFEMTLGETKYTYKVFAVYSVDVNDAQYTAVDFESDDQFLYYMNTVLADLSIFPVDTQVGSNDQVLTLSTCSHTDYANGRFVVHAVRVS